MSAVCEALDQALLRYTEDRFITLSIVVINIRYEIHGALQSTFHSISILGLNLAVGELKCPTKESLFHVNLHVSDVRWSGTNPFSILVARGLHKQPDQHKVVLYSPQEPK